MKLGNNIPKMFLVASPVDMTSHIGAIKFIVDISQILKAKFLMMYGKYSL